MKTLNTFLAGAILSTVSFYAYNKYYDPPFQGLSQHHQKLIDKYVSENQLQNTTRLQISKAFGLLHKKIYYHGLMNVLQGYKFHQTYVKKAQDQKGDIKTLYCIFNPNQSLCWHPETIHGGIAATMIDQNSGLLCNLSVEKPVATAEFNLQYLYPIKQNQIYVIQTKISSREGRQIRISSQIKNIQNQKVTVNSNLLFKTVDWYGNKKNAFFEAIKTHIPKKQEDKSQIQSEK